VILKETQMNLRKQFVVHDIIGYFLKPQLIQIFCK
jgi:hypothetical protein